jgi:hypothetical protein
MSTDALGQFLQKVATDAALRTEFTTFAAKHGFDLSELAEDDLDDIAGGRDVIVIVDPSIVNPSPVVTPNPKPKGDIINPTP